MKIKLAMDIDIKRFRQACVMFDIDVIDDDTIQGYIEKEYSFDKILDDEAQAQQMELGIACLVIAENMAKEEDKPIKKSKFAQRLEEAQKKQHEQKD